VTLVDFPTIHTNFWDAVIAVPVVIVLTQLLKIFLKIPRNFVPTLALVIGLFISVFISHRHSIVAGLFMGWFYGYAAVGSYASIKTSLKSFREKNNKN
jgi:cell shape-determining protein MreD